jgi:hypothetical protein
VVKRFPHYQVANGIFTPYGEGLPQSKGELGLVDSALDHPPYIEIELPEDPRGEATPAGFIPGEAVLFYEERPQPLPGAESGRRGACRPGPHDDDIVLQGILPTVSWYTLPQRGNLSIRGCFDIIYEPDG